MESLRGSSDIAASADISVLISPSRKLSFPRSRVGEERDTIKLEFVDDEATGGIVVRVDCSYTPTVRENRMDEAVMGVLTAEGIKRKDVISAIRDQFADMKNIELETAVDNARRRLEADGRLHVPKRGVWASR